jgi:RNA polymerase sigma factor (sigma-70 family)
MYKKFPEMKRFLATLGCTNSDAEDIFQEALLIYSRKRNDESFVLTVEPIYFVKNVCKLLWFNQTRKNNNKHSVEIDEDLVQIESSSWFQKEMKLQRIETAIEKIGKQCQELLHLFYGLGWNMVEIAKKIGLRNEKVAKAQKYRCIQKAKEEVVKISDNQLFTHF